MTRDIALRFNHHYGDLLTPPEAKISKLTGVLPGIDGRKMSKSYNNTIPIFADEGSLKKTIMKIKTNSLEPGVPKDITDCNIFAIFKSIAKENDVKSFQQMYEEGIGWGDAKTYLFDNLSSFLSSYKKEYQKIIKDRDYVETVLKEGANKALEVSTPLIENIRNSVGIKGFSWTL